MSEFNDNDFAAMKCIINYARSLNGRKNCSLNEAKNFALRMGHTQESIDNAVKFWAQYEAGKRENS